MIVRFRQYCFLMCLLGACNAGITDFFTGYEELSMKVDSVQNSAQKHIDILYERIKTLENKLEGVLGSESGKFT